ncbi:DNA replication complex GINS protein PSF1-like [Oppia nitens]|uniref:DNA replication complex GINS protein PSF1-like n=1 Tax=Oppia nitens TaxID=1686743 RepID=UPI0023DB7263|nr:DNA replication complex GINS protein PSF1-like [Oppia nitens]
MFGVKGVDLVKSLTRQTTDPMPDYCHQLVDQLLKEMTELNHQIQKFVKANDSLDRNSDEYRNQLVVTQIRFSALLWNKRCLLAYHWNRLDKLKRLRWQLGSVMPEDIVKNLSADERQWFLNYSNNLSDYMNKLNDGRGIDLTLHQKPPKRLYIQVRCNTEYGDLELDDGTSVVLTKDSMHYLPLSQCEKLILGGVLTQI